MYLGCHTDGTLPGGLNVSRRASNMNKKLLAGNVETLPEQGTMAGNYQVDRSAIQANSSMEVSCFAIAVNEVNASLGRGSDSTNQR